jgi:hypothetical protein
MKKQATQCQWHHHQPCWLAAFVGMYRWWDRRCLCSQGCGHKLERQGNIYGDATIGEATGRAAALVETRPVPHAQTRPMASWRCRQTAHAKEITQEHQHIESCFSHCWSRRRNHFYWETVYSFPFSLQTNLVPHQFFLSDSIRIPSVVSGWQCP